MPQPKDKDWLNRYKNKTPITCCLQQTHLKTRDTYRLKVKSWKNIHANRDQKKAGVAISPGNLDSRLEFIQPCILFKIMTH